MTARRLGAPARSSTLIEPGPNTAMYSMPPMIAAFFRKWFIWFAYWAASNSQTRCAISVAMAVKRIMSHATRRACQPAMRASPPPISTITATQTITSGMGKPSLVM